jgi:hypothetical protein
MTLKDDIHTALEALWSGDTGASIEAIKSQPALMGLQHVADITRKRAENLTPSEYLIAKACRDCISRACEEWATNPDLARAILGVGAIGKGLNLRERRDLVVDRYEISYEVLTHKRPDKPAYEKRVLRAVASQMAISEDDYIVDSNSADSYLYQLKDIDHIGGDEELEFACERYAAEFTLANPANRITLERRLKLISLVDAARQLIFYDAWASRYQPLTISGPIVTETDTHDVDITTNEGRYGRQGVYYHLRFSRPLAEGSSIEVKMKLTYDNPTHHGRRWIGFWGAAPPSGEVVLKALLPVGVEEARGQLTAVEGEPPFGDLLQKRGEDGLIRGHGFVRSGLFAILLCWYQNY